jgi:bacterioferritin
MRGDERVIEVLNEVLTNELTATNQYYLHYAMQKNWGFTRLATTRTTSRSTR